MRTSATAVAALVALFGATVLDGHQTSSKCVTLGAPKPAVLYSYRYTDTSGATDYTNQWKQFSVSGSELVTTRANGMSTYVSVHSVANDVFVLQSSTASGTDPGGPFTNSMSYSPGAIGDPAFKACEGQKWQIPAVNATSKSARGSFSMKTDPGALTIVSINETVTVPAGTFNTVRYTKTMNSGRGQVRDEFWKSIEHGVTVKRTSTQPGSVATEVLVAIK
jgi:hypothetical protein